MSLTRVGYLQFAKTPPPLSNVVVLSGREHLLADDIQKRLTATLLPDESMRPLNLDTIDALEDDFSTIADKLGTLPFLSDRRMIVIRNVNELRNEDRIELRDALPEVADHAVLLVDDVGEPRTQRGKAPKDRVTSPDFAEGQTNALLIDCTLSEADRERYIEDYAATLGISVDVGARRYLAGFESVYEIRNALERLSLIGKRVSRAAAEEYVKPPGDPKLWDLGNAVGRSDVEQALMKIREIVTRPGDETGPLIWLAGDAQIVWELASGATPNSWAAATGSSPFRAIKLWDFARRRSPQAARDNVRLTMRALEDSLTGRRLPDQALDEIVIRLCAQK